MAAVLGGCINIFRRVDARAIDPEEAPVSVQTPVKVHLTDGSVVLFPHGASFAADAIRGTGRRYGLDLRSDTLGVPVEVLPLDSVAALETYREGVRPVESLLVSTVATAGGTVATAAALVAIFGSCPTIYSQAADSVLLEGEAFSNSIVPLFEQRDVNRLGAGPDTDGTLELEVRNEALETHYINHLELVEVVHAPGTVAVAEERGAALVLGTLAPPAAATDRAGRDVAAVLAAADRTAYETAAPTLEAVQTSDLMDHIDLVFPAPTTDRAALYLRLRNSLLSTVFLYDVMLAGQGPRALDWMGRELNSIGGAVRLGAFYRRRMGLRVQVWDGAAFREAGRVREVGPIAWDHVAVPVEVPPGDSLRIRLHFIADAWRIDRVALAGDVERGTIRTLPLARVLGHDRAPAPDAHERLARPDEAYHVTTPGERFWVQFEAPPAAGGTARTYFLAAQGYYTEWIRGDWVRSNAGRERLVISDETLYAALQRWRRVKDDFERRFETSRIPVR